jgi:hypothetical protein
LRNEVWNYSIERQCIPISGIRQFNEAGFMTGGFVVQPEQYFSQPRLDLSNGIRFGRFRNRADRPELDD